VEGGLNEPSLAKPERSTARQQSVANRVTQWAISAWVFHVALIIVLENLPHGVGVGEEVRVPGAANPQVNRVVVLSLRVDKRLERIALKGGQVTKDWVTARSRNRTRSSRFGGPRHQNRACRLLIGARVHMRPRYGHKDQLALVGYDAIL
jgi:hypothetical protein